MNTRTLGVLVVAVFAVASVAVATVPAGAQSEGEETYVHRVDSIDMAPNAQICAESLGPNVNKVTVGKSTHFNTTIYHHNTNRDIRINIPKFNTLYGQQIVLFTDGSNPVVEALAESDDCTPPGQDVTCTIVLNEYRISLSMETPKGIEVSAGPDAASSPPAASQNPSAAESAGCLGPASGNESGPTEPLPDNPADDTLENATDPVDDTLENATSPVNDTVGNVTDEVDDTTNPVTELVEETVETVQETVEETVDTVRNLVGGNNTSSNSSATPVADSTNAGGDSGGVT